MLVSIEGGRAIAARDVLAQFASATESISTESEMAGFVVIAWDDQGRRSVSVHQGKRCPFAPTLIPDFVKQATSDFQTAELTE